MRLFTRSLVPSGCCPHVFPSVPSAGVSSDLKMIFCFEPAEVMGDTIEPKPDRSGKWRVQKTINYVKITVGNQHTRAAAIQQTGKVIQELEDLV